MLKIPGLVIVSLLLLPLFCRAAEETAVTVFPLANLSLNPDLQYLSDSLPDSLATTLRNTGRFKVRPAKETKISRKADDGVEFSDALQSSRASGDGLMITGNYAVIGDTIRISLEAVDAKSGRVKIAEEVTGRTGIDMFDLVDGICAKMADRMLKELPKMQEAGEAGKVREKTSVETVYLQGSRKNSWFFTQLGFNLYYHTAEEKTVHRASQMNTLFSLGYGFRGFRFIFSGSPPLFTRDTPENRIGIVDNGAIAATIEYSLPGKRLYLIAGYRQDGVSTSLRVSYFDTVLGQEMTNFRNYQFNLYCAEFGARYRLFRSGPFSGLSAGLKLAVPFIQRYYAWEGPKSKPLKAKDGIMANAEVEWMFLRTTGVRLSYTFMNAESAQPLGPFNALGSLRNMSSFLTCSLCYNVDF